MAGPALLSAAGWAKLSFIDDPVCRRCGAPFAYDHGADAECPACIADPPAFDRARAAVLYDEAAHHLIVSFKHADRSDLAPLLAGWLARAGAGLLTRDAVLTPVPLHPARLFKRRYNQAALLVRHLSKRSGATAALDGLRRMKKTPSQQGLSAAARRRNLEGAIAPTPKGAAAFAGKRVIIVDDVLTTGATLSAAARAARRAGAAEVFALVLARVPRHGMATIEGEAARG